MNDTAPPQLSRTLGPLTVTFYGLGTIVGAGIYVLLGSVAGLAGGFLPYSFLIAGLIAGLTAMSYAELSARLPECAGAAVYIEAAWHHSKLSATIGWLLVLTGIVSASAIANGFVGYLNEFITVNRVVAISSLILILGIIATLNMQASAILVFAVTLLEVFGLVLVVFYAWTTEPTAALPMAETQPIDSTVVFGVMLGSFVAFYAFIGFEDMVNVVEEVKNPRQNLPIAILVAVASATVLYMLVAVSALRVLPAEQLAASDAPLSALMAASGGSRRIIAMISLIAVINGALVQIIMASRVLYGMATSAMIADFFARVNPVTHTPINSTLIIIGLILVFALSLPITQLAQLTSFIMLVIFSLVNLALIQIKRRATIIYGGFQVPLAVPVLGAATTAILLLFQTLMSLGVIAA
jgi:amino acid transporter